MEQKKFIDNMTERYGSRFSMSGVYLNMETETLFIDNYRIKNGLYITPYNLLYGRFEEKDYFLVETKKTNTIKRRKNKSITSKSESMKEIFITKLEEKFPNTYTIIGEYIDYNTKVRIRHNCDKCEYYEWDVTPNNILHGKGSCPRCENKERGHDAFVRKVSKLVGDEYLVISEYTGAFDRIILQHNTENCQHKYETTGCLFVHAGIRCPKCSPISKGEDIIRRILESLNVTFKSQYIFKDCKYKSYLRFDFGILNNKNELLFLIEYQGEQHYKPCTFMGISKEKAEEVFKETQIKDKIKKDYCSKNNICLLEITYKQKNDIEKILEKELSKFC